MPLASESVQWIPVATQKKLLRKHPKSQLVGLHEGKKVADAVHCDNSTLRVEYPTKAGSESRTAIAVEKCGSKDD
jgi:hypothetical protein